MSQSETAFLRKDFESSFTFTRSTGPVVGRFLTELRNKKIVGIKGSEGIVLVPPPEYDPVTFEPLTEFVEVGQSGTVKTWCWVNEPRAKHPLDRPFVWAMVLRINSMPCGWWGLTSRKLRQPHSKKRKPN